MADLSAEFRKELRLELRDVGPGGARVLALHGPVTYREAPALRDALYEAIADGSGGRIRSLRVDLAGVEKMDTAALAVLIELLEETRQEGPEIHLCSPSEGAQKLFQLASFVRLVSEAPDPGLDDALRRCRCDDAEGHRPRR